MIYNIIINNTIFIIKLLCCTNSWIASKCKVHRWKFNTISIVDTVLFTIFTRFGIYEYFLSGRRLWVYFTMFKFTVYADQEALPPRWNTNGFRSRITQGSIFGNLLADSHLLQLTFHGVAIEFWLVESSRWPLVNPKIKMSYYFQHIFLRLLYYLIRSKIN